MRKIKKGWLGAILSLVFVFIIGGALAFKSSKKQTFNAENAASAKRAVQWVFIGDDPTDILDYTQYSQTASEPLGCGAGQDLPCTVNFPDEVTDDEALEDYLTASGRTNGDILALSPDKRDQPPH